VLFVCIACRKDRSWSLPFFLPREEFFFSILSVLMQAWRPLWTPVRETHCDDRSCTRLSAKTGNSLQSPLTRSGASSPARPINIFSNILLFRLFSIFSCAPLEAPPGTVPGFKNCLFWPRDFSVSFLFSPGFGRFLPP